MSKSKNPAALLHSLLADLCKMPPSNPARYSFNAVFKTYNDDTSRLLQSLGEMVKLALSAEEQIRSIQELDLERYLNWKPDIVEAFGQISLRGDLSAFIAPLKKNNGQALERLQYCADRLSLLHGKELEQIDLTEIQTSITSLKSEIRDADVDAELKVYLLYQLGVMADAINRYSLFGIGPLESATNEIVGSLVLNEKAHKQLAVPVLQKFRNLVVQMARVVKAASDAVVVEETVRKLLTYL
jgi:hypothetical protein